MRRKPHPRLPTNAMVTSTSETHDGNVQIDRHHTMSDLPLCRYQHMNIYKEFIIPSTRSLEAHVPFQVIWGVYLNDYGRWIRWKKCSFG